MPKIPFFSLASFVLNVCICFVLVPCVLGKDVLCLPGGYSPTLYKHQYTLYPAAVQLMKTLFLKHESQVKAVDGELSAKQKRHTTLKDSIYACKTDCRLFKKLLGFFKCIKLFDQLR